MRKICTEIWFPSCRFTISTLNASKLAALIKCSFAIFIKRKVLGKFTSKLETAWGKKDQIQGIPILCFTFKNYFCWFNIEALKKLPLQFWNALTKVFKETLLFHRWFISPDVYFQGTQHLWEARFIFLLFYGPIKYFDRTYMEMIFPWLHPSILVLLSRPNISVGERASALLMRISHSHTGPKGLNKIQFLRSDKIQRWRKIESRAYHTRRLRDAQKCAHSSVHFNTHEKLIMYPLVKSFDENLIYIKAQWAFGNLFWRISLWAYDQQV